MNKLLFSRLGLALAILGSLVVGGVSACQAGTDLYIGFNDAAGPDSAQNDYVIDIGAYSALTNAAGTNGGTIDLMSSNAPMQIVQSIFSSNFVYAYSGDASALNDVAAGAAGADSIISPKTLWQTAPTGVTPGIINVQSFNDAEGQPGDLLPGEYVSTTINSGWTYLIAQSPTQVGTDPGGDSVAASTGTNPMGLLVSGNLVLNLWQNTETTGRSATVVGWVGIGYFTFNVNSDDITFTLGAAAAPPPIPTIATVSLSGGNFGFSGGNGQANAQYRILSTTNLSIPGANWTPVYTNSFSATGTYSFTIPVNTSPAAYFRLISP